MKSRVTKSAWILVAVLVCAGAGYGQVWHGRGGFTNAYIQDRDDNRFYRQGFRDGQDDAHFGRSYHIRSFGFLDRDDRDAYQSGYDAGFREERAAFDAAVPRPYYYEGGAVGVAPYGPMSSNPAYDNGFRDGLRHGASDRSTGHSYRPTKDDSWQDADRGYVSSLGSKQAYKEMYRQGYEAGYDRGFRERY